MANTASQPRSDTVVVGAAAWRGLASLALCRIITDREPRADLSMKLRSCVNETENFLANAWPVPESQSSLVNRFRELRFMGWDGTS
jgi:hypothetical protein